MPSTGFLLLRLFAGESRWRDSNEGGALLRPWFRIPHRLGFCGDCRSTSESHRRFLVGAAYGLFRRSVSSGRRDPSSSAASPIGITSQNSSADTPMGSAVSATIAPTSSPDGGGVAAVRAAPPSPFRRRWPASPPLAARRGVVRLPNMLAKGTMHRSVQDRPGADGTQNHPSIRSTPPLRLFTVGPTHRRAAGDRESLPSARAGRGPRLTAVSPTGRLLAREAVQ